MALPYLTSAGLPYGTRVLSINGVSYIANNYTVTQPANLLERSTELGAPNGAVLVSRAATGTAELQLATSSTAYPARGDEFTADTVVYFLTEVGKPEQQDGFKVVNISFREKV